MRARANDTTELNEFYTDGSALTNIEAEYRALDMYDRLRRLVNDPASNMFVTGKPHESTVVPVFSGRLFIDYICFGGKNFDG